MLGESFCFEVIKLWKLIFFSIISDLSQKTNDGALHKSSPDLEESDKKNENQ